MRKLKLIWEFRGGDAEGAAKHHAIHLNEFGSKEKIYHEADFEVIDDLFSLAYMIIEEKDMIMVRDALIPQRGEWID